MVSRQLQQVLLRWVGFCPLCCQPLDVAAHRVDAPGCDQMVPEFDFARPVTLDVPAACVSLSRAPGLAVTLVGAAEPAGRAGAAAPSRQSEDRPPSLLLLAS